MKTKTIFLNSIFLTLLLFLFLVPSALSTITPQELFKKQFTVQYRANVWQLSTTYVPVTPKEQQGVLIAREDGKWEPINSYWFYNIDQKKAQPFIDEFEKTLKKHIDKVIPVDVKVTIGIWMGSEEVLIMFGATDGSQQFYEYMLEKIRR